MEHRLKVFRDGRRSSDEIQDGYKSVKCKRRLKKKAPGLKGADGE
jgi:hypothetical protein